MIPRGIKTWVGIPRWKFTRVIIPRWIVIPGLDLMLNYDPRSEFHVELRPRIIIQRWIVTCDWDHRFNVEFWPGITIQCGIMTRVNFQRGNLGSQFNVEFWPVYISSTRGITTQEGVKIQQRDQTSTAKEGHNSTKNPLNIDPGSVFNGGVKILSYTGNQ